MKMKRVLVEYNGDDALLDKRVIRILKINGVKELKFSAMERQIEFLRWKIKNKNREIDILLNGEEENTDNDLY